MPVFEHINNRKVSLARSYGLCAQLECLDYARHPHWLLADLSREQARNPAAALNTGDCSYDGGSVGHGGGNRPDRRGSAASPASAAARAPVAAKDCATALRMAPQPPPPLQPPQWLEQMREVAHTLAVGHRRGVGGRVLPQFFLQDGLNGAALLLRVALWLCPCPEADLLLLDWARAYPRAGGVTSVLPAMVASALRGDFRTARKLGFAQQLVSSQSVATAAGDGAGDGGGGVSRGGGGDTRAMAASTTLTPTEAAMQMRNAVAVAEVARAATDGCRRVGILYGGLHMRDLQRRLLRGVPGQLPALEPAGVRWETAWRVATVLSRSAVPWQQQQQWRVGGNRNGSDAAAPKIREAMASTVAEVEAMAAKIPREAREAAQAFGVAASEASDSAAAAAEAALSPAELLYSHAPLALLAAAYVTIGAWDWADTISTMAAAAFGGSGGDDAAGTGGGGFGGFGGGTAAGGGIEAVAAAALYVVRHAYMYYGLSKFLVQWDEKLF
ncbi:unnamed protein product [Phaeothamnion confervicola]